MRSNITEKYKKYRKRTRLEMLFGDGLDEAFNKGVNEFKTTQVPFWEID